MAEAEVKGASPRPVIIHWQMSSFFGWGVYGLNLAVNWVNDPDVRPLFAAPLSLNQLAIDAMRLRLLEPVFAASQDFQNRLQGYAGKAVTTNSPVLQALGNGMAVGRAAHDTILQGNPTIGVIFFENTQFDAAALERARSFSLIVTGSTWNTEVLRGYGLPAVETVIQGIDPTLFHPAPRAGFYRDRFLVFSGGKLEYRKGQDLVLLAFKAFSQRHPEAMLVTAWHSPWAVVARTMAINPAVVPVPFDAQGRPDARGWAAANGIPPDRIIDLGAVPNALMPSVLREVDVALFPNRSEGGTNLVAMECMACGVPTILSNNTGHRDLIDGDNSYVLRRQGPVAGFPGFDGTAGWGESDVEEIVEALESAWRDRTEAQRRGALGAATLGRLTWANQTRRLKDVLLPRF